MDMACQGGTLAAVLAALQQAGEVDILPTPPRFCLIFAGLLSRDYRHLKVRPPLFVCWNDVTAQRADTLLTHPWLHGSLMLLSCMAACSCMTRPSSALHSSCTVTRTPAQDTPRSSPPRFEIRTSFRTQEVLHTCSRPWALLPAYVCSSLPSARMP